MIRVSGQVVRAAARGVHFLMVAAMGLLLAVTVMLAGLAVRLSMGPIHAGGATYTISMGPADLSFDGATLAWEGFHRGTGLPIELRLVNVAVSDSAGRNRVVARQALVSLAFGALLHGQIVPREIELDDGLVTLARDRDGVFSLGLVAPSDTAADSAAPDVRSLLDEYASGQEGLGQLDQMRLRNFTLTMHDIATDKTWQASAGEVALQRQPANTITGVAHLAIALGEQQAELAVKLGLLRSGGGAIDATLGPVWPARIADALPDLPQARAIDLPVSLHATLNLAPGLIPADGRAEATLGEGRIVVNGTGLPIRTGRMTLSGTAGRLAIEKTSLTLAPHPGAAVGVILDGTIRRQAERLSASLRLAVDRLDVADLASLWPPGVGGGARPWILHNLMAGTISHISAGVVAEAGSDFSDIVLTKATGDMDGDDVAITWLDQVPPIEKAQVHLRLLDPDRMLITMPSGRQRISNGGADLLIQDGQMTIAGLSVRDQTSRITLRVAGPVASAITLLKEPRLHLLSKQPFDLKDPSGDAAVTIALDLPLENSLRADQIGFQIGAHLEHAHVTAIVAGRDMNDGTLDLTADKDGLTLKGQASLASVPVSAAGSMDFNAGPPNQVLERIAVSGRADAAKLAASGVDVRGVLGPGQVGLTAVVTERRSGEGSVALSADLAGAALRIKPLGWSKAADQPSRASALVVLSHDRVTAVSAISAEADDLALSGSADCPDGLVRTISIDHARIGRSDLHGVVRMPAGGPADVILAGKQIDLSAQLQGPSDHPGEKPADPPDGMLRAQFDTALLANGQRAQNVSLQAAAAGGWTRSLALTGSLATGGAFSAHIAPADGKRHLSVEAADAGAFLAGSGLTRAVRSGRLSVGGDFDDTSPDHRLTGTIELDDARLADAPILAKLLQGMTLYGLADLLSGPGMGVTRTLLPFTYDHQQLRFIDGRLFSSSVGLTVKGLVDLSANRLALSGTIVPAYVINSMLGRIPFVGKLFSPEAGGGLFAARYAVDGPFGDANVTVNPLSVLTPGFLRDLFDIGSGGR